MLQQLHEFMVEHPVGLFFFVIGIGYQVERSKLWGFAQGGHDAV